HIHGLEDESGVPALVLELVEGLTLAERIANGPVPLSETIETARQIADGSATHMPCADSFEAATHLCRRSVNACRHHQPRADYTRQKRKESSEVYRPDQSQRGADDACE